MKNQPKAFPVPENVLRNQDANGDWRKISGMDLRDYFAAKALTGIIAAQGSPAPNWERCANHAYHVADAMIEERKRKYDEG